MPTWDKEKASEYYKQNRDRLRRMKREKYLQKKKSRMENFNENVLSERKRSSSSDHARPQ